MRRFLAADGEMLVVPITVLPELDYLLGTRLGVRAQLAALRSLRAGEFRLEAVHDADLIRCIELMEQYADSAIGLVDASIVAVAERLSIRRIVTFDRRHFAMFRPRHCDAFDLLP